MRAQRELRKRLFRGEREGEQVVEWLNGYVTGHPGIELIGSTPETRKRVWKLVKEIEETITHAREVCEAKLHHLDRNERIFLGHRLFRRLNRRLKAYHTSPTLELELSESLPANWQTGFEVGNRGGPGETYAVLASLSLANAGLLDRVRQCICGQYFFAHSGVQISCSAKCRHKLFEQGETFKEKRRAYMRNYYKLQKKNVK